MQSRAAEQHAQSLREILVDLSQAEDIPHGVDSAHYSNGHMGYQPVFRCVCGFGTSYANGSWHEAGAEFDEHLDAAHSVEAQR